MKKVIYDYSLRLDQIENDKYLELSTITLDEIKRIAKGRMFIFFEPKREYIILDTGIIDYLLQIKGVIEEIDNGNIKPFSVSCDWYSNSLEYTYDINFDVLKIREVNGNLFEIETKYKLFKKSFEKFYKKTMIELSKLYPELSKNKNFVAIIPTKMA